MKLDVTVLEGNGGKGPDGWSGELRRVLGDFEGIDFAFTREGADPGQLVFVDARIPRIEEVLGALDRRGRAVFVVQKDGESVSRAVEKGAADDILVRPFRSLEIYSKLKLYQRLMMWNEVSRISQSFAETVERFQDDVKLVERLQKAKLPALYPNLKGIKVSTRYVAGLQPGGDHFDLADAARAAQVSLMLTRCNSYGLSSSLLAILMRVALKLSVEGASGAAETVGRIHQELALTLGEKDQLSIFFGVLSRKDMSLRYLNLGAGMLFHAPKGGDFKRVPATGPALRAGAAPTAEQESTLALGPEDRLMLLSEGFLRGFGDERALIDCLDDFRDREQPELLNELMFRVKSKLAEPDDLPEQDCTAVVLDVDGNVLRLAK